MNDLLNYVYVPVWLLVLLAGLAFIGLEFVAAGIIKLIDRWFTYREERRVTLSEKPSIVLLEDRHKAK